MGIERVALKLWSCMVFVACCLCFYASTHCDWLEGIQEKQPQESSEGATSKSSTDSVPGSSSQGVLRKCSFVSGEEVEDESVAFLMLENPPSKLWKASAVTLGMANGFGGVACVLALVILISCAKCTDNIIARIQQVICIGVLILEMLALVFFLAGIDNDETHGKCGDDFGFFRSGNCKWGKSINFMIASMIMHLAGIVLSFIICYIDKARTAKKRYDKGLNVIGLKKKKNKSENKFKFDQFGAEQDEVESADPLTKEQTEQILQQMAKNPQMAQLLAQMASHSGSSSTWEVKNTKLIKLPIIFLNVSTYPDQWWSISKWFLTETELAY